MGIGTSFLKKADRLVSAVVPLLGSPAPLASRGPLRRMLLIRPGGIGDAVLLIPALLTLKGSFPDCEISVLAERRNGAAFSLCGAVDRLLLYDKPSDLARVLWDGGYDAVIDTEQWHRLSAVVARLTGARVSLGFATNERAALFTDRVEYRHQDYEMESFFHLLAPLGIGAPGAVRLPFLTVPDRTLARAAELLAPLGARPFVAVFPGASIAERRWGAERFREVAARLTGLGFRSVVVGGKGDVADAAVIAEGGSALSLAGKTSLTETAAVIQQSALLLSGDSGLLHIAVGLGRPTVSLFGPGIAAKWAPRGKEHTVLNRRLSCSPCTRFGTTPPCPFDARCLSEISIDEVVAAVIAQLKAM